MLDGRGPRSRDGCLAGTCGSPLRAESFMRQDSRARGSCSFMADDLVLALEADRGRPVARIAMVRSARPFDRRPRPPSCLRARECLMAGVHDGTWRTGPSKASMWGASRTSGAGRELWQSNGRTDRSPTVIGAGPSGVRRSPQWSPVGIHAMRAHQVRQPSPWTDDCRPDDGSGHRAVRVVERQRRTRGFLRLRRPSESCSSTAPRSARGSRRQACFAGFRVPVAIACPDVHRWWAWLAATRRGEET